MLTLREEWVAEWLPLEGDRKGFKECSRCRMAFEISDTSLRLYRYCPFCGSLMKGEEKCN